MNRAPFDLIAPLPRGRTVIEASAGTGKTYALTALIVRYLAEADIAIDQFLVVTFTRAAATDLRDRTRDVLRRVVQVMSTQTVPSNHPWMSVLLDPASSPAPLTERHRRLETAVARFDDLTITTLHGFCQQALTQLGIKSGVNPGAELVDKTRELAAEVCRDLIITHLSNEPAFLNTTGKSERKVTTPQQAEDRLLSNITTAITNPLAKLAPPPTTDDLADRWVQLTEAGVRGVLQRQQSLGQFGYDSLVSGLHRALTNPVTGASSAAILAQRSSVVLVDEFQDTDRLQWDVLQHAFAAKTLITVGDPKQAIYRFRGADVHAYLDAIEATSALTLDTNYRSDATLISAVETVMRGATLGDSRIQFAPVIPRPSAPVNALRVRSETEPRAALQIRMAPLHDSLRTSKTNDLSMPLVRTLVLADLVQRTIDLLDNGFITDDDGNERRVQPGDIAILVPSHLEASNVAEAMRRARIPAVRTRTGSVFKTAAAMQWRLLLTALANPHDPKRVRAGALGWFLATDPTLLAESEAVLEDLQEHVGALAARLRSIGLNAFYDEQKSLDPTRIWGVGVLANILGREGGDRHITDLDHIAELLAAQVPGRTCDPLQALRALDNLIVSTDELDEAAMRRIDSDSLAVQITTIHSAKGLEYPIVMLPFGFKPRGNLGLPHSYNDARGKRTLDLASTVGWDGGCAVPNDETTRDTQVARREWAVAEIEGDELRLLYVALTRAAHRVELWWASTGRATSSALARVLLDRQGAGPVCNTAAVFQPKGTKATSKGFSVARPPYVAMQQADVYGQIQRLADESDGLVQVVQLPERLDAPTWGAGTALPAAELSVALPRRGALADPSWRRWSFSGISAQLDARLVDVSPGTVGRGPDDAGPDHGGRDEPTEQPIDQPADLEPDLTLALTWSARPPLADVAGGTAFGTFVHRVLEHVDFAADDLAGHVRETVTEYAHSERLPIDVDPVVEGLVQAIHTPLGPLFDERALRHITRPDRLDELTFDMPLHTGTLAAASIGEILLQTLAPDDSMRPFATQLAGDMAGLDLAGWMHGSIDAVLRIPAAHGHRYVVIDYKTNRLHAADAIDPIAAYRPDRLVPAMEHSRYPLQALLYTVALHRFLRWRLGHTYDPDLHLGGIGYLFVRGMTGPGTERFDGCPHGVFAWRPPTATIMQIDQLFATGRSS